MKLYLVLLIILVYGKAKAQEYNSIKRLSRGDSMQVESLVFNGIFQKATLVDNKIYCTVLDLDADYQRVVVYQVDDEKWKISKVFWQASFYTGENIMSQLIAGKSADIKGIPDLANERDIVYTRDFNVWFTSDYSGYFQIYEWNGSQVQKVKLEQFNNQHIINLWVKDSSVFFDVISKDNSTIYALKKGQLQKIDLSGKSISFNDTLLSYIKNDKLVVLKSQRLAKPINFIFAFLDTNYDKAITFSSKEASILGVDSGSVKDGVLKSSSKEKILINLENHQFLFSEERKNFIEEKLGKNTNPIQFTFVFLDDNYDKGISLNNKEANILGIDSNSIIDGVLIDKANAKIRENLIKYKSSFSTERFNKLEKVLGIEQNPIQFVFGFIHNKFEEGLSFSQLEASILGIDNSSIVDGIFTDRAKQEILKNIELKKVYFNSKRREQIKRAITKDKDVLEFYGFFADTGTFVSSSNQAEGVASNGIISIEGLQKVVENNPKLEKKYRLKTVLVQRSWDEEKVVNLDEYVEIQLGAYHTFFPDFALYLLQEGKITRKNYHFLQDYSIFIILRDELYLYRTVTKVKNLVKLKKIVYFDHPFIVDERNDN